MNLEKIKSNKLSTILQYSIPSIIAMMLTTVITITDGFFTGNYVGEEALAALNLGLPIIYLFLGLGLCVGVGGSVISGQLLGSGDKKKASEVFSQTTITSFFVCVVTAIAVVFLFKPLLNVLGAQGVVATYFTQYYKILLFELPIMVVGTVLGMFIRTDGKPQFCMLVSIVSVVLNIILDYILVAKLSMGVRGSAIASLIVESIAMLIQLAYFFKGAKNICFKKFKFDKKIHRDIIFNGSSEFIGEMSSAIAMFSFNFVLMKYAGVDGVAAFTVMGYAVYFYSMIAIGFGQGISPLISLCWGADEKRTAVEIRKLANRILFVVGIIFALSFFLLGSKYAGLFGCGESIVKMVSTGFKFYAVTFVLMGFDVINSMYFTSCADAKSSAFISFLRGIFLLLIFIFVLPVFWGINGVWFASPLTEIITSIVSIILLIKQKKKCLIGS
ncbi:MAG: MATE family efflux transporter [Clostridiales bacterium]|nr:MATE family efflux transporter [Clostridiales bacterium]